MAHQDDVYGCNRCPQCGSLRGPNEQACWWCDHLRKQREREREAQPPKVVPDEPSWRPGDR